jgi:aminoglycoside phosphotransferase (APT) family kinase protein
MARLPDALVRWVVQVVDEDATVTEVRGLREGGPPWLLRLACGDDERAVVLRIGDGRDPSSIRTEQTALSMAAAHGVPVPRLLAVDVDHDPPLLLTEAAKGSSAIPHVRPPARLRALGATAAALHRIAVPPEADLAYRDRPLADVDFEALRKQQPRPLLVEAEDLVGELSAGGVEGFVHGDLWQGNTIWAGDTLTAVVDWDCAGKGPAGVDLGSLRCDAAMCFGVKAAEDVLEGWEAAVGRPADDVAYWDVVATLSTPPDMGWFVQTFVDQGRPDLTRAVLVGRRDEFLAAALAVLRV